MKSKGNNNKPVLKVVTTKTLQPPKRYHSADVCLPAITRPRHNSFVDRPCTDRTSLTSWNLGSGNFQETQKYKNLIFCEVPELSSLCSRHQGRVVTGPRHMSLTVLPNKNIASKMVMPKYAKTPSTKFNIRLHVKFLFLVVIAVLFCCQQGRKAIIFEPSMGLDFLDFKESRPMTDSSMATVMGFATGYDMKVFRRFVGSLRRSGFRGNIILGVSPDIDDESIKYLHSREVKIAKVNYVPCTHGMFADDEVKQTKDGHEKELRTCVAPYDKLKARWGRFPFLRDQLRECLRCTGPVLIADVRDTFFQRDPFGSGQPQVHGLQVFQEHENMTTQNWLVEWPVRECKNITFTQPMLCSGTTIGTRQAMLRYLDEMEREMNIWMADTKCHFKTNGDDQSIHNYLYYSGRLPYAMAIPNGFGIVNTIGYQASSIFKLHKKQMQVEGKSETDAYEGTEIGKKPWITQEYHITDEEGYILDHDGKKSAVVHQYDRFGVPFVTWLVHASGLVDDP